jgi:hypothetical protein
MRVPLHDDELTAALLPTVADLIVAVHDLDQAAVAGAFEEAGRLAGDDLAAARLLAVLAAGICLDDQTLSASLGWTLNPDEYQRLRSRVDALTASQRAGRTAPTEGAA